MNVVSVHGEKNGYKYDLTYQCGSMLRYDLTCPDGSVYNVACNTPAEYLKFLDDPGAYLALLLQRQRSV